MILARSSCENSAKLKAPGAGCSVVPQAARPETPVVVAVTVAAELTGCPQQSARKLPLGLESFAVEYRQLSVAARIANAKTAAVAEDIGATVA